MTSKGIAAAISIHAPAKGATSVANDRDCASKFQSTLPRRERHSQIKRLPEVRQFQSTLPRRERLLRSAGCVSCTIFQSTLPRRERRPAINFDCHFSYFNPRSREGSDVFPSAIPPFFLYFNPRSREGSDSNIIQQISFSLYNTVYFVSNNIK